jgi:hypothetical protein
MLRAGILAVCATLLVSAPALADSGSLPGGTSISAEITSPASGAILPAGATTVSGTAAVGAAPALKNNTVVYALDVSGSTADPAGVDCDGIAGNDSTLTCEKAAVSAVNADATGALSPVLNSGVVKFSDTGTALDVDPAAGTQVLTAPGPNIDAAVATLTAGGGTSYVAGVTAANSVLSNAAAASTKTLVFLSDGADTSGGTLPAVPSGTTVRAFAIGSGTCASGPIPLSSVAALGGPGSSCTQVTNLSVLDDVIGQQVGSTLSGLAVSLDGGPAVPVPAANIVPTLPQGGPASVTWTTSVTLANGSHNICVTATGSDAGGAGGVNDCVPVQVVTTTVNCTATAPCTTTSADGAKSTATLVVQGINDTVGIRPATTPAGGCGGVNCVTAYDVLFNTNVGAGTASLAVTTAPNVSTPFLKAAVYLDGVKVTRNCLFNFITKNEKLPCQLILPTLRGGTFYFVKFTADPNVRFR